MLNSQSMMFIEIGKILATRNRRIDLNFHLKNLVKQNKESIKEAENDCRNFGGFEDCGDFYDNQLISLKATEAAFKGSLGLQVERIHKYEKRLTHAFTAKYPDSIELLNSLIAEADKDTYRYLLTKITDPVRYEENKRAWGI